MDQWLQRKSLAPKVVGSNPRTSQFFLFSYSFFSSFIRSHLLMFWSQLLLCFRPILVNMLFC